MEFGLNLYSIRNLIETEEGFLQTAKALKDAGYSYIQCSAGLTYDPVVFKRVSEESGLPIKLTHAPYDRILGDTDKLMEEHAFFGCKNIGLGILPFSVYSNEKEFKEVVEKLNAAAEKMEQNGFKFFHHNHHYEFIRNGNETLMDYMIKNAPYINFTLDTYWAQYGGVEVCDLLDKLNGRIECVHLKDYKIEQVAERKFEPKFAPIGDGTMNFEKIIAKMKACGAKYFFVEQDNAADLPDTLGQVTKSVKYLNENFGKV